jgi:PAS domain S-box-containing protein
MVGIDPQNLDQHLIFEVLPEESLAKVQNQVLPILLEKGAWNGELQYRNLKTGELVDCQASTFIIYKDNGEPLYLANISRDITESKQLEREIQEAFERRGSQVQVSTEIAQEIASTSELSELFSRVVTLTKERFGYYHTQLLRYDATQDAVVLINGYGETGQKMLADGHKLPMGFGLIGTAASSGQTILRPFLAEDPDWQPNPLLPDTQGEIAVPIKLGEQVLGVLDVQSNQAGTLTEDDRLLLEGLCGQIAVAIEQTRLRQEMSERLEEVNRLYRNMSHEGWKTYQDTTDLPAGFMFDQAGLRPVDEEVLADELFANIPMRVLGGEIVGTLTIANDPNQPTSDEDHAFFQQVSDQIALALESARLTAQTQSALAQTEKLSDAGLRFARATNLQELLAVVNETLGITGINRILLGVFNYSLSNEVESMDIAANWWNGIGHEPSEVGRHYTTQTLNILPIFISATPVFFNDTFDDERINASTLETFTRQNIHSMAVLPLYLSSQQIGVLFLESEAAHNFTQDEIRLFSAMAPQIATVLENRRQFERAQQQANRESTLNVISQKIQSATTVEAVLQIAARELGHALGAPMTIAQLSMKDKK